jgi:phage shock protein C
MFCPECGKQLESNARFCSACGATINSAPDYTSSASTPYPHKAQLTRSRANRMIAGICAGFAQYYGWDLNVVRIVTFLIILCTGVGALAYLAAWIIIPEGSYALPAKTI